MFEKVCTDFDIEIAGILAATNNVIPESYFGDYIVSMKEANELHQNVRNLKNNLKISKNRLIGIALQIQQIYASKLSNHAQRSYRWMT